MFGDLDWPLKASRRFVSISWASCYVKLFMDKYAADLSRGRKQVQNIFRSYTDCWTSSNP